MSRIAIIAALPGELKPLVKTWQRVSVAVKGVRKWVLQCGEDEWLAVCAGIGAEAVRRAFSEAETGGGLDMVLSVGWAGATNTEVKFGAVMIPSIIVDAQTGESFHLTTGKRVFRLVTTARVATSAEKARLWNSYGAVAVDMEAATIARLAEMRGISLVCIKAISDDANAELPNLNPFIDVQGQMQMSALLGYVALHPRFWVPLARLGKHSAAGAKAISDTVGRFMKSKDADKVNRTGNVD